MLQQVMLQQVMLQTWQPRETFRLYPKNVTHTQRTLTVVQFGTELC
jgi:hypothetical protein